MTKLQKFGFLLLGLLIGAALSVLINGPDAEELGQAQYCEMVALNRADPTVGWPDYNESYDRECKHAQDVSR